MTHLRARRGTALALALGLAGAMLPVALAGTAHAADACTSEAPSGGNLGLGQTRCDDVTPPETTIGTLTPAPNSAAYVSSKSITIAFSGAYTDADTDPISYECQFFNTQAVPTTWTSCTSPVSYDKLDDSGANPYTFRVRAIDSADAAIDATSSPDFFGSGASSDLPDVDQSPAQTTFRVDTVSPNTYIFNTPYDDKNPETPMVYTQSPTFRLAASEAGTTFACTIDGAAVPCREGLSTFPDLAPGDRVLSVSTTDVAGNVDASPASTRFAVPENLTSGSRAWTTLEEPTYVGGDYLTTKRNGASVTAVGDNFREVRLLCSTGPTAGRVDVRMPSGRTYHVSLKRKVRTKHAQIIVRDQFQPLETGRITVVVTSTDHPVVLDGMLVH